MNGGENIRNNSVQLNERRRFDQRQPECVGQWESKLSCWDSSEVATVMVSQGGCRDSYRLMDFHRAASEAPHQRLFANARCANVCVHVTERLCLCLGGSETCWANVAISEAGSTFATIACLCFLFGLDPLIFPCNGREEATEIGFL